MNREEDGFFEIHVTAALAGQRLDQVLSQRVSRRLARRLIEAGAVFVDRRRVKVASRPVFEGSVVRAPFSLPERPELDVRTRVVFEEPRFLVADKPPDMATAPTLRGEASLSAALEAVFGRLWIVSRLDFHTSGLVPFVREAQILTAFEHLLRSPDCVKEYAAVTARVDFPSRMLDFPIGPHPRKARRFCVRPDGKPARTEILEVVPIDDRRQFVRLRLHTGRTHQIRVHLAHVGACVWGDPWYPVDQPATNGPLHLHAARLAWRSPLFGDIDLSSTPPWLHSLPGMK